jgi:hypothetical protein
MVLEPPVAAGPPPLDSNGALSLAVLVAASAGITGAAWAYRVTSDIATTDRSLSERFIGQKDWID